MWFKNISIYQLPEDFSFVDTEVEEVLQKLHFRPCGSATPQSVGWIAPMNKEGAPLIHAAMQFKMLCFKIEEKVLPTTVVREYSEERIKEVENLENRNLSKREKASIKDQMYFTLIQQAFCRSSKICAYFDLEKKFFVVNNTNAKKLELFMTHLKKVFPNLELQTPETRNIPQLMTQWLLTNEYPTSFAIEKSAVLEDYQDVKRVIRVKNQDLFNDSIQALIKDGCVPKQINLTWFDRVTFNLNHDLSLSAIKYDDAVVESADDGMVENEADRFSADFLIMTQTLQQLLEELLMQFSSDNAVAAAA